MSRTFAIAMILALPGLAEAGETARGTLQAVTVAKGPAVDGTLKDPAWQKCPPLVLGDCTTEKGGAEATTARMLFSPTHLYVAWQCAQADTGKLRRAVTERDGDVWKDDCVELFVAGDIREGFRHFIVNANGVLADATFTRPKQENYGWNSSAVVRATVQDNTRWTVTLSVPLTELGAYVGEKQTWVANLNRTNPGPNPSRPIAEWSWAILGSSDYHQIADFGRITGVSVPKRADGVTRTATPPPPPPSYNKGGKAGSVVVYHRFGDVEIADAGKGPAKAFDVKIRNANALKLAFLARGTGGITSIPLNMYDRRASDNTTAKGYRRLPGEQWLPVIYFCDRFRYNARVQSTIARATEFSNIRFHGRATPGGKGKLSLRDFVVYRGEDATPPPAPQGLQAASEKRGVCLTWQRVKDNTGVALYAISRAHATGPFTKIAESALPEHIDKPPAGTCRYRVLAVDFQDNLGAWSAPVTVKNPLAHPRPAATSAEKARASCAVKLRAVHAAGVGKVRKGVVLMFGDSLTYATSYRTAAEGAFGRYRVEAKGYPGQRTSFGKGRIDQDLAGANPQFCCILLGTNNSKSDQAIKAAMGDILAMVRSCHKRGTVAIVGTIPPRGFKDPDSKPEARYNAALIKTCRANRIPLCHLFEGFQAYGDRRKLLAGDGVHWAGEGFPLTGKLWKQAIDQVNFVLLDRP